MASGGGLLSWYRVAIIAGAVLVVLGVISLGVGLGMGLNHPETAQTQETCIAFDQEQFSERKAPNTHGSTWLNEDCSLSDQPECPEGFQKPPLIIISLDGFRADYMKRNLTPVMEKISNCGVKTEYMRPVYPSKTFPNHYSVVTGLYPESHGIVDNIMVDLDLNQIFSLGGTEKLDTRWWHGEPIWVTARKAGKISATMFWPGSEIKINGYYPNRCYWYDGSVPFTMRIDRVLTWLEEPVSTRPEVITLYFEQPDKAGHKQGPHGQWVNGNLTEVDNLIGDLMDGLIERKLHKCVDVVILSDHGMAPISENNAIDLTTPLNLGNKGFILDGLMGRVTSKYTVDQNYQIHKVADGVSEDELVSRLECTDYNTTRDYYTKVYKKADLPVRLHYSDSPRIEEVVVMVADEWQVEGDIRGAKSGGSHGYDNTEHSMEAIFMAYGSSFKRMTIEPFESIEVYNLMADVLQINPAPNNGTTGSLRHILHHPPSRTTTPATGGDYHPAPFPDSRAERDARRASSDCNCTHEDIADVDTADLRLNLTAAASAAAMERHLGVNKPTLEDTDLHVWSMVQENYVSAYSKQHKLPLWAGFELNEQSGDDLTQTAAFCSRVDVRLEPGTTAPCAEFSSGDVSASFLVPPGIVRDQNVQADAHISTNMVPMYTTFREGIWRTALEILEDYRNKYKKIQVLMGPIFDHNRDGLADTADITMKVGRSTLPMPSHFFIMLTRCTDTAIHVAQCPQANMDTMAVILPHLKSPGNCWNKGQSKPFEYLKTHVARVRDIELITGLAMLPGVADVTKGVAQRTSLSIGLWPRTGWLDNPQCPQLDSTTCSNGGNDLPVLLVSLDGFRPDYLQRGASPLLNKLTNCGVRAPYVRSIYPTLTFPNHYSLATGLYPESNNIVENSMYDPDIGATFYLGSPNASDPRWWSGEPIWNTVTKQGKKSATFFWPGSDVEINGMRPDEYYVYDGLVPYSKRVDTVIDWLTGNGGLKTDLAILYLSKVDEAGHSYGPNAPEIAETVSYVDGYLEELMDGLKRNQLDGCVNIVISADHGMADIDCIRGVTISDMLSSEALAKSRTYQGAAGRMALTFDRYYNPIAPDDRVPADEIVFNVSCQSENMNAYTTASLPKRLHYSNNKRIGEVVFLMKESWQLNLFSPWCPIKGQHGWDPMTSMAMKGMFTSYGPSFKRNYTAPIFENIEIYNLLAKLLSVDAAPNNGTEGSLDHMLATSSTLPPLGGTERYTIPKYPSTDEDYIRRSQSEGCSCVVPEGRTVREYDERLNLDAEHQEELTELHIPHGRPRVDGQLELQSVWAEDYLTAYSPYLGVPLWVAYTITAKAPVTDSVACLRPDVRLEPHDQPSCDNFHSSADYIDNFLFPPSFATSEDSIYDAHLLTNTVPMRQNFASGVWRHLVSTVHKWSQTAGTLHVLSGPVFDYDADGVADKVTNITVTVGGEGKIRVPSHFYVVILRCPDGAGCTNMNYDTQAFVVPHQTSVTNCMDMDEYLYENRVRVRDVELLTGLRLLTKFGVYTPVAIQTRTAMPTEYGFLTAA